MQLVQVILAATSDIGLDASGLEELLSKRPGFSVYGGCVHSVDQLDRLLSDIAPGERCALVLVGVVESNRRTALRWLQERSDIVILQVHADLDIVELGIRNPDPEALFSKLEYLVSDPPAMGASRIAEVHLTPEIISSRPTSPLAPAGSLEHRPLLNAARDWAHSVLHAAVRKLLVAPPGGDAMGQIGSRALYDLASEPAEAETLAVEPDAREGNSSAAMEQFLSALNDPHYGSDPLACLCSGLELTRNEILAVVLALAPDLDVRLHRWMSLLDEHGRAGGAGLFCELIGEATAVQCDLARTANLLRWRIIDGTAGEWPEPGAPLRLDAAVRQWLLGKADAPSDAGDLRTVLRRDPWPGASLVTSAPWSDYAVLAVRAIHRNCHARWVLLACADPANWHALIERAAVIGRMPPLRVAGDALAALSAAEIELAAIKLARVSRITRRLAVIDLSHRDAAPGPDDPAARFLSVLAALRVFGGVITRQVPRVISAFRQSDYELVDLTSREDALRSDAAEAATRLAAGAASAGDRELHKRLYALNIEGLERAVRLARHLPNTGEGTELGSFLDACKIISGERNSAVAERIEPRSGLAGMVLPEDTRGQLREIVNNVTLASRVLDTLQFGELLPYGRGVTALFHGPSGTGKTMAALAVAHELRMQLLRLDLSRVVSKYIGETEKNIDGAFEDARISGAGLLIDEADALLGRRSAVGDAHDRYANIEVAFLLQRLEAFEGLAILTTNLRQNIDPAFQRRLRFVVEFPRPDAAAREKLWRQSFPPGSHEITDSEFVQLARKIECSGGTIRQIAIRSAFAAAAVNAPVRIAHVVQACRAEYQKLGLPPLQIDADAARKVA